MPIMTVRSRSSLRFSVRREDQHRVPHAIRQNNEDRTTIPHSKSAPNLIQKFVEHRSSTHPESLGSTKTPLQSRRSRSRRRSPLSSQQPIDHVDDHHERPYKKLRLDGHFRESAATRYPLRDQDRAESPDPLNAISSPVDTAPARPPARPSHPGAFVTVSPPSGVTRSTRRSLRQLPVAVDDDAEKHDPAGLVDADNNRGITGIDGASRENTSQGALDGTAAVTEKRSLRSQAGGSRSKSELAMYFQNYEQMLSLEPPKPEFLTGDTTVVLVDDLTQPPLSLQPPLSPSESQKHSGPGVIESPFGNPLLHLHESEKVTLPKGDPEPNVDPLGDEHFFKAHRRVERQEKQLRNIERERAQHEKIQLDRLLDELQGHDWLRVMGISGITDTEKKLYEPKRALFIKEVSALINKFRVWKEEEKRRKLEKGQHLHERDTPAPFPDHETPVEEPPVEEEVEEADEDREGLLNGTASSDIQSFGEPPDINDVDAWAARQLLEEARSASGGKRAKAARAPSPVPAPPPPPEPEKPFTSFYAKRYLRDAAMGHHRRGRSRTAFGLPIPDFEERDFHLPPDILTEDAIQACQRKRRRLRRASQG